MLKVDSHVQSVLGFAVAFKVISDSMPLEVKAAQIWLVISDSWLVVQIMAPPLLVTIITEATIAEITDTYLIWTHELVLKLLVLGLSLIWFAVGLLQFFTVTSCTWGYAIHFVD
jgi:hypothetical protein